MAGATKVTDLRGFADELILHTPLPPAAAAVLAYFLPWLELTCGVCLALGFAAREAAALVAGLLVLFLGYTLTRGRENDCGCFLFPAALPLSPWWAALRDVLLLACCVPLLRREVKTEQCADTGSKLVGRNSDSVRPGPDGIGIPSYEAPAACERKPQ